MTKQDILDYVAHTTYNTNLNVLSSLLDQLIEDSKGEIEPEGSEELMSGLGKYL